jgi:hypothetical protein
VTDLVSQLATLTRLRHLNLSDRRSRWPRSRRSPRCPTCSGSACGTRRIARGRCRRVAQTVTSLDLSNTHIGDRTLAALAKLPNLRRLYVSDTAVTPAGLASFKQQRPATVVSWGVRPEPREPLVGSTKARGAYTE